MLGFLLALAVAIVAAVLGHAVPIVGAPVFAIVIGAILATLRAPSPVLSPGITFAAKQLLQWSIVLLGAHLSLSEIAQGGAHSLPVMLGTLAIVLVLAYVVGRLLGLDRNIRRLVGVGTAICGGSAIAAVASVIEADQADVAYSLGVVFLFNVVAVLIFPALGHLMQLSQHAFGLWAGTAINDTSSVVAASFSYGRVAGNAAVIVKLTRTTLIIPIVLFYGWRKIQHARGEAAINWRAIVPWFILWFLAAATLNSFGLIPPAAQGPLQELALFSITVALAGVGLGTEVEKIRRAGMRPLVLGAILWIAIALSSLAIARLVGAA
ncbi:MAG TPA: putative sulfate exporter family transporter [Candidatus Baltobacteraceae bacterium]|nr:putative sulfate exporter family transporter [Candidatus Baltobacteraceae bacterium]